MPIIESRNLQWCSGCEKLVGPDPTSGKVPCCGRCKLAYYCDQKCQKRNWRSHKPLCKAPKPDLPTTPPANHVKGVRLLPGNNPSFQPRAVTVSVDHPIWTLGTVSPVSQLVGMPVLLFKELHLPPNAPRNWGERSNQAATYFMIDPSCGFAPPKWQDDIGSIIVVRADQNPLAVPELAPLWSYCCDLLDMEWGIPEERPSIVKFLSPKKFKRYQEEQSR